MWTAKEEEFLHEFHWLMDVLQNIDVGLVILDRKFCVHLWNSFMQNHSSKSSNLVLGKNIFELFPELPEPWFRRKADSVFLLQNTAFTTWEQRQHLFRFENYRPVTGMADHMYQNSTLIPLKNTNAKVEYICLVIYDVTEVAINKLQLQRANRKLHIISRTDGLTGLLNRKTWECEVDEEFRRFQRYGHACSMLMFDIDHFKEINDNYGHVVGDEVIRKAAKLLIECIRDVDIAGRYGGEEFSVMLADTKLTGARALAERVRQEVEHCVVEANGRAINFTISLGVAELTSRTKSTTHWIECADNALYRAKNAGRNNVSVFNI